MKEFNDRTSLEIERGKKFVQPDSLEKERVQETNQSTSLEKDRGRNKKNISRSNRTEENNYIMANDDNNNMPKSSDANSEDDEDTRIEKRTLSRQRQHQQAGSTQKTRTEWTAIDDYLGSWKSDLPEII